MAKPGRPPKYRKDFHPKDFIEQSKKGKHILQIALSWDIHIDTIYDWSKKHQDFSEAVKKGKSFSEGYYMNLGEQAMLGEHRKFSPVMFVWLTKNKFGWTDKQEVKQSAEVAVSMDEFKFVEPKE